MTITVNKTSNSHTFSAFHKTPGTKNLYADFINRRYKRQEPVDNQAALKIAAGSLIGTVLPLIFLAKKQFGKINLSNLINLNYGVKEMLAMGSGSVIGGVASGIAFDKNSNKKRKMQEGVFQFMNSAVPTLLVGGVVKLMEGNEKYKDSKIAKLIAIPTTLLAGMTLAAFLSNIINDPKDKEPDRKLTLKDSIVNLDDALSALIVAKVPFADKLQKAVPIIFAWCGYKAGQTD